jgi:hypothetical protein
MALHQGLTYLADAGYAGDAVIHLSRLLDAKPLKERMATHDEADLGLIVADGLFEEVIRHNPADLRAADFERVEVEHPDKDFRSAAWISLPDTRRRPADPPTQPAEPHPRSTDPRTGGDTTVEAKYANVARDNASFKINYQEKDVSRRGRS